MINANILKSQKGKIKRNRGPALSVRRYKERRKSKKMLGLYLQIIPNVGSNLTEVGGVDHISTVQVE